MRSIPCIAPRAPAIDLILCRNTAFTYFAPEQARAALERLVTRLRFGGALVIGEHEELPREACALEPWPGCRAVYRLGMPLGLDGHQHAWTA